MPVHSHIFVPNARQKQKQLESLQQKVGQFDHRARKELWRALKLVRGLAQQRASKLLKNTKKAGPDRDTAAEVLAAVKGMPLDALVNLLLVVELGVHPDVVLAARQDDTANSAAFSSNSSASSALARFDAASPPSSSPPTANKNQKGKLQDIIFAPLSARQRRMANKWVKDARVISALSTLREKRRQLKTKARHLRDRLSRKDKREAIKQDPSLKPKKRPKPEGLPSQKDMFLHAMGSGGTGSTDDAPIDPMGYYVPQMAQKKKKKNRMGQRERKRLALQQEAKNAHGPNRSERRARAADATHGKHFDKSPLGGAPNAGARGSSDPRGTKRRSDQTHINGRGDKKRVRIQAGATASSSGETADKSTSHPSWAARSQAKEKEKNASFAGRKKTFDDSDSDED